MEYGYMTENEIRHFLYAKYKNNFFSLIEGIKTSPVWKKKGVCPPLSFIIKEITEAKIARLVEDLETLELKQEEFALQRNNENSIRTDLLAQSVDGKYPVTIIELKKSNQTARQAFTELLAYNNYFCRKYPPLEQKQVLSVLVSPAEKRIILDAYIQELLFNDNPILLLEPKDPNFEISHKLKIVYPSDDIYKIFDNALFHDDMFTSITLSLPNINGWLDCNETENRLPNQYTQDAINTISNSIALELEKNHIHAIVYGVSYWKEIGDIFPYPHTIVITAINPFRLTRWFSNYDKNICKDFIEIAESNFSGYLLGVISPIVEFLTNNTNYEIGMPEWGGIKVDLLSSACVHYYKGFTTGILRQFYIKYMMLFKELGVDLARNTDDLSTYPFDDFNWARRIINTFEGLSLQNQIDILNG